MHTTTTPWQLFFCKLFLGLAMFAFPMGAVQAQTVYGLATQVGLGTTTPPRSTSAALVTFTINSLNSTSISTVNSRIPITGVPANQYLVGLDFRPSTGELFALGYDPATQQTQLYSISQTTAAATPIGQALVLNLGTNVGRIGFDFNPTADRIRVTAGNGGNFRLNPNDGALVATDGPLAYAAADANAGQIPRIGSSAYTNSYAGATGTTLYNLDELHNRLVIQTPPNDGILNTIGPISVNFDGLRTPADLDIYFNSATGANVAYISVADPDYGNLETRIFALTLATGNTTLAGRLATPALGETITDIAMAGTSNVTSTREQAVATNFTLYPNPVVSGEATVSFMLPHAGQAQLTVTDALGRTVAQLESGLLSAGSQSLRWQTANNKAGLYFVRLTLNNQSAGVQRVVVR